MVGLAPRRGSFVCVHLLRPAVNIMGCGFPFPGVSRHALAPGGHLLGGSASIHLLHLQEEGYKPTLGMGVMMGVSSYPSK